MKRKLIASLLAVTTLFSGMAVTAQAASKTHTVVSGDTLWKIAVKYQVGTSEIISANPQINNPDLIYPGQVVTIPTLDSSVSSYEQKVIDLVNEIRVKNGLKKLTANWELSRVARYFL